MNYNRQLLVRLAEEILRMNHEINKYEIEIEDLKEYKKQRQEQDAKYVNDSVNGISDLLKVIVN